MSWHDLSVVCTCDRNRISKTCYKEQYVANFDVLIADCNFKYDVKRFQLIRIREKINYLIKAHTSKCCCLTTNGATV